MLGHIDPYKRYQDFFFLEHLYPIRTDGLCACGCKQKLTGRRTRWATNECRHKSVNHFYVIKGHSATIRYVLFKRDGGECAKCGEVVMHWDADHIIEVRHGGGGCGMDNYQTLCKPCHKIKTKENF